MDRLSNWLKRQFRTLMSKDWEKIFGRWEKGLKFIDTLLKVINYLQDIISNHQN
jgi:hypothetical protein